jgi:hypothetical protein
MITNRNKGDLCQEKSKENQIACAKVYSLSKMKSEHDVHHLKKIDKNYPEKHINNYVLCTIIHTREVENFPSPQ